MSEVCVGLLLIQKKKKKRKEKKRKIPNLECNFIPQLKGGRVHVVRPRVSVENELADWKNKNEKLGLRFSHNHTCKTTQIFGYSIQQRCLFFVQTRVQWCSGGIKNKNNNNKKKKGGLGGKSCITRCPTFLHMGVKATEAPWVWWGGSDPRDGVPSAGVRRQSASPPSPSLSPSAQLTVGTWFKLYSLALSRRLAMLLAMFIPWDVLVLEQVGG